MDESQRNALIESVEAAFRETGVDIYAGAQRLKPWLERLLCHVEAARSRESLDDYFASFPEEDDAKAQQLMALCAIGPTLITQFVQDNVVQAAKQIGNPKGRPLTLTPEFQRKIIAKIVSLIQKKVTTGVAQIRCAKEFGVSKRTIQTVWGKRDQFAAQPFQSMDDIWKLLGVRS